MESNKSIRLRTTPGLSQNIQVKIEQEFDTIDFLSLKITQEEAYRNFCSDYGVVAGRVIANDGFGVENAKISVFIPLSDEDAENDKIRVIYPYRTPRDTNQQNIRYNLLPRLGNEFWLYKKIPTGQNINVFDVSYTSLGEYIGDWENMTISNPQEYPAEEIDTITYDTWRVRVRSPHGPNVPVGTFPSKVDILGNDILLEVYDKYYKLSTTSNSSGDYMIFGVPIGTKIIHMDVDLSDAGQATLAVDDFLNLGFPPNLFDGNNFKASTNLDSLPQIESRDISVDVIPFWGNTEQCEIGITRLDFNLNKIVTPSSYLIFQSFTNKDGYFKENCGIGGNTDFYGNGGKFGKITEMEELDCSVSLKDINGDQKIERFTDGNVVMSVKMYEDRLVTNEFGALVPSDDPNKGIPTSGRYTIFVWGTETHSVGDANRTNCTARYSSPQVRFRYDLVNKKRLIYTLGNKNEATDANNGDWRKCAIKSEGGNNIYSYPSAYQINNRPSFGNEETCYGSLYFPKFEDADGGGYCDKQIFYDEQFPGEPYGGFRYQRLKLYGILDITDLINRYQVFGGGLPTTSATNGLYNDLTFEFDGVNLFNNTVSFWNTSLGNVDYVTHPNRLNTDTQSDNVGNYINRIRGKVYQGGTNLNGDSYVGRYFYYFGLKPSSNSLLKLKQRLS